MLEDLTPPKRDLPCRVRTLSEQLDPNDSKIFLDAINNPELWPANTLAKSLRVRGVVCADVSIQKHRRKECSCA